MAPRLVPSAPGIAVLAGYRRSWLRGDLPDAQLVTTALAGAALVLLFTTPRFLQAVPGPLLVVVLATAAVTAFGLDEDGVAVIGEVLAGLPRPGLPDLGELPLLLLPALGLLLVGYTDVILTARAFTAREDRCSMPTRSCWQWARRTSARAPCKASR